MSFAKWRLHVSITALTERHCFMYIRGIGLKSQDKCKTQLMWCMDNQIPVVNWVMIHNSSHGLVVYHYSTHSWDLVIHTPHSLGFAIVHDHRQLWTAPWLFDKSHGFFILSITIDSYRQHPDFLISPMGSLSCPWPWTVMGSTLTLIKHLGCTAVRAYRITLGRNRPVMKLSSLSVITWCEWLYKSVSF